MECNKEEAFRAKDIAIMKMHDKDFMGARRFALKAQQLYPDTENISQMICVCDVHCAAENKMFGIDLDWCGILQIDHTADDTLIKKQYRKFALLLHPDKNKFAGAEAAFKLIGEAQRVLLDKEKRSFYDMKRRTCYKPVIPNQPNKQGTRSFSVGKESMAGNNFRSDSCSHVKGFNPPHLQPKKCAKSGVANGGGTFWTMCPFCAVRYQYYKEALDIALRCQSCNKSFVAYDMKAQGARPGSNATQPVFRSEDAPKVGASKPVSECRENPAPNTSHHIGRNAEFSRLQKSRQSHSGTNKVDREGGEGSKPSRQVNGKRGKKLVVESSESFDSDSSLDSEGIEMQSDDILEQQQLGSAGIRRSRKSSQNKRHVSYNENGSDDEDSLYPSKRAKESGLASPVTVQKDVSEKGQTCNPCKLFSSVSASVKESGMGGCEPTKKSFEADNGCVLNSSPETTPEPTFHDCPDPEFSDFEKNREAQCFKVGQVWAVYDTVDAMPRFYARIRKIFSPGFKVRITWLEADPDDEFGRQWADAELPFSCGIFKNGDSENTEDRLMFSHEISWDKGSGRNSVKIYPKKGETWALFKNWDAWCLNPDNDRKFEYEFVEIMSEYDENVGIRVAHLGKLKGFVTLFCRKDGIGVKILPGDVLRFSHRVPSFRMTGGERNDVLRGSFELDPASITLNLEEINLPKWDEKTCIIDLTGNFEEVNPVANEKSSSYCHSKSCQEEHGNIFDVVNGQNIADPEFSFDDIRSIDKFKVDQVWALYSDVDNMPKCYGVVKKIDPHPHFKLHIEWLEACYLPTEMISWKNKNVPITCGEFKIKGGKMQTCTNTSLSHPLRADSAGRKSIIAIYPQEGEVWALYKNLNADMTVLDLRNCEYDIVVVLEDNDSYTKVLLMEHVEGSNLVFKPQQNGKFSVTKEIPRVELLKFSHQIPYFKPTDEKSGSLRGLWKLDRAAFPEHVLYKLK